MSSAWGFWILFSVQVLSVHSEVFVDKGGYIMYYLRVPENNPTQAVPLLQGAGDQLKFSFRHCNKDGGLLLYQGGSGNTYFAIGVYNNGIYIEMNLNDTLVEMSGGTGPSGVFADVPDSRYTEVTIVGLRQPEHANVTVDGRTVMLSTSTPGIQGPSFTTDMLGSLVIGGVNSHVMMKTEKLNKDLIPCISFIDVGLEGRTLDFNSADVKHWVSPMCPANSCFSGTSATFTSVDSYVHLDVDVSPKNQTFIGFKFRTRMKAGLLFFFGGPGGWLALYLRNGALVLRLNTEGRGRDAMKTTSESTFNDGEWHEVRVVRQGDKAVLFDGNGHAAALVTYGSGEMLKPLHVTALYVGGANTTVIPGVTSALLGCMEEFIFASFDALTESQPRGLSLRNNNIDSRHVVFEGCTESESCDPRCPSPAQTCSLGVCDCAPGHSEVTRDPLVCSDIDDCAEEPCVHGVCTDQPNDYICECTPEYKGRNCSVESSCYKFPCSNGATCVEDQTSPPGIESRTCHCFQGYEGVNCSKDIDECSENACVANITRACVNYPGGFSCLCVEGWTGQDCSEEITPCHEHPCGLGVCNVTTGGYNCTCPDGTIGQECAHLHVSMYRQSHLPIVIGVAVVITIVLCALLYILLKKGKCKGMEICLKSKIFGDRGYRYRDIYAVS
ncbi:neurexin 1-like isoform X2 [Branchiostoma floridae x Branchiostoma japonicum]